MTSQRTPADQDAIRIVENISGRAVDRVNRFLTGTSHYVFDVTFADGSSPLVLRLARSDLARFFQGAVHWYPALLGRGVPLPDLVYSELDPSIHGFAVMLMRRLPGHDLGDVYSSLTLPDRTQLAAEIATIQLRVQSMSPGPGFGYATSYRDKTLHRRWIDVVWAHLERSKNRITDPSVVGDTLIEQVAARIGRYEGYFDTVAPTPFLDDTTTKNVIIDRGKLSGVVDVDFVCFGDIVQLLGLIQMALLSLERNTDYVDFLAEDLAITEQQRSIIPVYALVYGVDFLTAAGHRFNKDQVITEERSRLDQLRAIVDDLLESV